MNQVFQKVCTKGTDPLSSRRCGQILRLRGCLCVAAVLAQALFLPGARAFSLLGPYADWMTPALGYQQPGDIGGPMDISEGYRWNVPVVTYGFDQSFLDYFGSNGVAAVEGAIQILNDLPPASAMVLSDYPTSTLRGSQAGFFQHDLKSAALASVVEQMGLADPERYVFALRRWDALLLDRVDASSWDSTVIPYLIVERNFDPEALAASHYVNAILYSGYVYVWGAPPQVVTFSLDATAWQCQTVADGDPLRNPGEFFTGLTRDDVGGLRYLLSAANINYEYLLPDVQGVGTNAGSLVNGAWRPGVEKITFVRQPVRFLGA